jgi:hypothetical protein
MQTYVRYDTWGRNAEVRPIGEPITYKGETPESLVGRLVNVRPYYHAPNGRSSLAPTRSPFVFEAYVTEAHSEMVKVRFAWGTDSAPWSREAVFYPHEVHQVHVCECAACKGDGIGELRGA